MKRYASLVMAAVLGTSAVANCTLAVEQQAKTAAAAQGQKSDKALEDAISTLVAANRESDFKECAAMLTEFMQKHPEPNLTDYVEGYYLVAQCQEKLGQIDAAMFSYAKAEMVSVEPVPTATVIAARERLERLYRGLHNGTLVGIEKVYRRAKASIAEPGK